MLVAACLLLAARRTSRMPCRSCSAYTSSGVSYMEGGGGVEGWSVDKRLVALGEGRGRGDRMREVGKKRTVGSDVGRDLPRAKLACGRCLGGERLWPVRKRIAE